MSTITITMTAAATPMTSTALNERTSMVLARRQAVLPSQPMQSPPLREILLKFEKSTDWLSLELLQWGAKVIDADLDMDDNSDSVDLQSRIHELMNNILVNPLEQNPLESPVIDRDGWTWESRMLEDYMKKSNLSPFDAKKIQPKPHAFAKAMLVWAKIKSPAEFDAIAKMETERKESGSSILYYRLSDSEKLSLYMDLAEGAIWRREESERRKLFKEGGALVIEEGKKLEKDSKTMEEQTNKMAEDRNKALEESTAEKERIFNSTVADLDSRIDDANQRLQSANTQLASAHARIANAESTIASQIARINHQDAQLQQQSSQLSDINNQFNQLRSRKSDGGGCVVC